MSIEIIKDVEHIKDCCDQNGPWAKTLGEAIALLRTHQDNQPNGPLTPEELRGMDGEPGWCKEYKHWGLISLRSSGRRANIPHFLFCKNGITWANNTQKMNLTIYRRPPKEDER